MLAVAGVVVRNPALLPDAIRVGRTMAPERWWARPPFLPLPDAAYWHFRMVTVLGHEGAGTLSAEQIAGYLRWCREMRLRRD